MKTAQRILILMIRAYQALISPALGAFFGPSGRCRYNPSCSHYALEAVQRHGAARGSVLAAKRLCRCHPWADFGDDPVPLAKSAGIIERDTPAAFDIRPSAQPWRTAGRVS
jgi:putative membrane protein insertion efficiency factor